MSKLPTWEQAEESCESGNGTALCSRCQQLFALEAEIGRAAIGASIRAGIYYNLDTKQFNNDAIRAAERIADTEVQHEIPQLIARWRRLHAAGAEDER